VWRTQLSPKQFATYQVQIESSVRLLSAVTLRSGSLQYPPAVTGRAPELGLAALHCWRPWQAPTMPVCAPQSYNTFLFSLGNWKAPGKTKQTAHFCLGKILAEGGSGEPGRAPERRNGGIYSWLHLTPCVCPWAYPLISLPLQFILLLTFSTQCAKCVVTVVGCANVLQNQWQLGDFKFTLGFYGCL